MGSSAVLNGDDGLLGGLLGGEGGLLGGLPLVGDLTDGLLGGEDACWWLDGWCPGR